MGMLDSGITAIWGFASLVGLIAAVVWVTLGFYGKIKEKGFLVEGVRDDKKWAY